MAIGIRRGQAPEIAELHVGLAGPTGSGKTNLIFDLERCIRSGFHGFEEGRNLSIQTNRFQRKQGRQYAQTPPPATSTTNDIGFQLEYMQSRGGKAICKVDVRDAPGEASFPRAGIDEAMKAEKAKLDEWFTKAVGIVLVVSVANARKRDGFTEITDKVEDFFADAGRPPFERLKRVVVAISMFDLLMLRFGPEALGVATDPDAVLAILSAHMSPVFDLVNDFRTFLESKRDLDLRFVATSSYGFHPHFGCPNVEALNAKFDPENGQLPEPLPPERKKYPYMTADPFIFAALGLENPFLFTRDQILGVAPRKQSVPGGLSGWNR